MEPDWQRLSSYIRAELRRRGWTQADLANEAGVDPRTVNRLLSARAKHKRPPDSIPDIERALGWEPDTVRKILLGAAPGEQLSREQIQREYEDILQRAMKLDPYHRRRIALYIAAQELAGDEE